MSDKYIVVSSASMSDGISAEEFEDLQDAMDFIEETDDKSVLIKCERLSYPADVEIEWYT